MPTLAEVMHMNTPKYSELERASLRAKETSDCSVIAYAACTGTDYETSHYIIKNIARRPNRGTMPWGRYLAAFAVMGYNLDKINTDGQGKTVITLPRSLPSIGCYLVSVSTGNHVLAIVNGEVIDWTRACKHRIHSIWHVKPCNHTGIGTVEMPKSWRKTYGIYQETLINSIQL